MILTLSRKTLGLAAMLAFASQWAAAETATLLKQDQLREAPYIDTKAVATVKAKSRAEIVEDRGAWVKLKAEAGEGWVRATSIKREGVAGPGVASIAANSGRQAVTTPTASLGIRGMPHIQAASSPTPPLQADEQAATSLPAATLNDLFINRDDRHKVEAILEKHRLMIGADKLSVLVTSGHPGYVYMLMADSGGKNLELLFPNQIDQENRIAADTPLTLPRPSWELVVGGPAGIDRLLVLVSDAPRDFKSLPLQPNGPFATIEATPANANDILRVLGGGKPPPECDENIDKQKCSTAYGAALVEFEEMQ